MSSMVPEASAESLLAAFEDARKVDVAGLAGNLARSVVQFYGAPQNQAYLAGCVIGAALTAGRMKPWAGILATMTCGYITQRAWLAAQDLHVMAEAARTSADPAQP